MIRLGWIDFDETERQRAQRLMELFGERTTRDELGLGSIRDSIADLLFPGTSTIQTRLRYMLFVPWLFDKAFARPTDDLKKSTRSFEVKLIDALREGNEAEGIIGRDKGASVKRLPSSVYWAGLAAWGIRTYSGSIESMFNAVRTAPRRLRAEEGDEPATNHRFWASTLPKPPEDLLLRAVFALTSEEAQFLRDRLVSTQPDALFTELARNNDASKCGNVWEHPNLSRGNPVLVRLPKFMLGLFPSERDRPDLH